MMPIPTPALHFSEPDTILLAKLGRMERVCLTIVVLTIAVNSLGWMMPALSPMLPGGWQWMKAESVLVVVLSTLCLVLSETGQPRRIHRLGMVAAAIVILLSGTILLEYGLHVFPGAEVLFRFDRGAAIPGRMALESAAGFGLLGCAMIVSRAQGRIAGRVADLFTFCASVATLTLVSGDLFASLHIFGMPKSVPTSPQTLFCLLLLTAVTVVRRTEDGMFSILTGRGIGGNLARILAPILLVLPFVREGLRAHILGEGRIPAHYATAILASMSAMVSIVLLAYLVARINSMEMEIRGLTLRDELTQLYNLRGFSLLAEQALRLAQRSDTPFSVLYIDLDNLKQTNDSLGHQAGSAFLAETGEILRDTFRETDLLGRIGGDEFAVAGQFSQLSMALAAQRLEARCKEKNAETGRQFALSFSLGHVTAEEGKKETLEELLVKADQAMYEAKRGKKTRQAEERLPRLREQHGAGPQLA